MSQNKVQLVLVHPSVCKSEVHLNTAHKLVKDDKIINVDNDKVGQSVLVHNTSRLLQGYVKND